MKTCKTRQFAKRSLGKNGENRNGASFSYEIYYMQTRDRYSVRGK